MNLFTYGSLMFPEVWLPVAGGENAGVAATLSDHAALKVRGASYPGLVPAAGRTTAGVLYLEVSAAAIDRLDVFEGSFYERTFVVVKTSEGADVTAFAYVVAPGHRHELEDTLWDAEEFRRLNLSGFLTAPPSA
jgi:gamma-glutamylcyclotransferase (GGCT)/AIG2-like uncharacterized protein YtfP